MVILLHRIAVLSNISDTLALNFNVYFIISEMYLIKVQKWIYSCVVFAQTEEQQIMSSVTTRHF